MKITSALATLTLATFAAACAAEPDAADDTVPPASETTPAPASTPDDMPDQTIDFTAIGDSQLAGDIDVDDEDGRTQIDVEIRNSTDGAVHQGHIHTGTCEAPGEVVIALEDVTVDGDGDGEAETTVDLPSATVMNGQHIVAYHEAGGAPGAPVLCAAIDAAPASM
jgi:hypothetical protein